SVMVRDHADGMARWLLQARIVDESQASPLVDDMVRLLPVVAILGAFGAWRLFVWAGYVVGLIGLGLLWGGSRWAPIAAFVETIEEALGLGEPDRTSGRLGANGGTSTHRVYALAIGLLWIGVFLAFASMLARSSPGLLVSLAIGGLVALPAAIRHVFRPLIALVGLALTRLLRLAAPGLALVTVIVRPIGFAVRLLYRAARFGVYVLILPLRLALLTIGALGHALFIVGRLAWRGTATVMRG